MTQRIYIDRSRIVTRERCPRRRWLEYHEAGTGIVPAKTPLALAVGGAVHAGLAVLLRDAQAAINHYMDSPEAPTDVAGMLANIAMEENAVRAALADFANHQSGIEIDTGELAAMQPTAAADAFQQQVMAQAAELGMDPAAVAGLARDPVQARGEFDRYLWSEQSALVEGLVRAYAKRRLRPLLEQFEVLEVEREGEWRLSEWGYGLVGCNRCGWVEDYSHEAQKPETCATCHDDEMMYWREPDIHELWFMSRPDALLRERTTNELYLLSYKTTATWDVRKARDIEHDMQGLSEGVEVERRLGEWWQFIRNMKERAPGFINNLQDGVAIVGEVIPVPMVRFLHALPTPPRIHAIRYEFLLKGYRSEDRELSARLGVTAYTQRSHLVRQYVATSTPKSGKNQEAFRVGDVCWAFEYVRPEDQQASKLYAGNWQSRQVEDVREWIGKLDRTETLMSGEDSTIGLEPRALGYRSDAQAMGVTREHPLEAVFVPPIVVYRSDDQLRDWVEQVEHAEREVAGHVAKVNVATDPGERRHLLNLYFPQHRQSCEYPSQCTFARDRVGVCWAGAEMQVDPLGVGGGEYVRRVANHPIETQLIDIKR